MEVAQDRVVKIAYTLKDDEGTVLDSSENHGDLAYVHGHQNIVEGLEDALEGKDVGETVSTTVEPDKGYGDRHDQLVFTVPRSNMPDGDLEGHAVRRAGQGRQPAGRHPRRHVATRR